MDRAKRVVVATVSGVVYGFLIELVTSVFFNARNPKRSPKAIAPGVP